MAAFEVDDGQPPVPQADPAASVESLVIRSAMADRIRHRLQSGPLNGTPRLGFKNAADAAHKSLPSTCEVNRRCARRRSEARIKLLVIPYHGFDRKLLPHPAKSALCQLAPQVRLGSNQHQPLGQPAEIARGEQ